VTICAVVGVVYEVIDEGRLTLWGPGTGAALGLALGLLDESRFAEVTRALPFGVAVVTKALTYSLVVAIPFLTLGFVGGLLQGLTLSDFFAWVFSASFGGQVALAVALYLGILFFRHLDRLLGPGILLRYITGKYHRPKREERIFMFLDLKSSTAIAERLDHESYYALLNAFFRDLTGPVLATSAEIYQYVGDEVVLTWTLHEGLDRANCLRVFRAIDNVIQDNQSHYQNRFGLVPEYKAGVHCGDVITAEIGELRKGIVYSGDVLNTASRIQGTCNPLGKRLLASRELVERLTVPEAFQREDLGAVPLTGKANPVELVALA
jgi:adenylate cyclase